MRRFVLSFPLPVTFVEVESVGLPVENPSHPSAVRLAILVNQGVTNHVHLNSFLNLPKWRFSKDGSHVHAHILFFFEVPSVRRGEGPKILFRHCSFSEAEPSKSISGIIRDFGCVARKPFNEVHILSDLWFRAATNERKDQEEDENW